MILKIVFQGAYFWKPYIFMAIPTSKYYLMIMQHLPVDFLLLNINYYIRKSVQRDAAYIKCHCVC